MIQPVAATFKLPFLEVKLRRDDIDDFERATARTWRTIFQSKSGFFAFL